MVRYQIRIDAAKLVRKRMPPIPNHLYDNAFVYGIRCDEPSYPKASSTFEQCEQLIHQIAELTDYSPQIVHLWGWQYRGKDTGYPAVQEVNQRIGGYDGMMKLMEKAKAYNCIATLSDNYDDAYRSSPAWDEKIIARRPDGELWESRNWTGENSYIIGLAKYMDVDVTLVRIAMVAAFFCSGGLVLLAYIVASFIMPVDYGLPVPASGTVHATS